MPLAFLIPGYIQAIFTPGIRTGRYFAIFISLLMLLGLWILVRRLGGRWWAALAVWIIAWNPAFPKMYSLALPQGIVACLLVWSLVLVLGEKRSLWQIALGSILAALTVMTRINMLPVLPLVVLYIFWQHGKKAGLVATFAGGFTFIALHVAYWPGILQNWTRIPRSISPFLDAWRVPNEYKKTWQPKIPPLGRILSFLISVRFHFVAFMSFLAAIVLWPRKSEWKRQSDYRSAVFLIILFVTLMLAHMWAALGKNYCVFCLAGYLAFFSTIGVLLLIITFSAWRQQMSWVRQLAIIILILLLSAGIGYGAFEDVGEQLYNLMVPRYLLGSIQPGSVPLGAILVNKFTLDEVSLRRSLPVGFGLITGFLILGLAWGVRIILGRRQKRSSTHMPSAFGYLALVIFLITGFLLAPTPILGGGYGGYDCSGDALQSYETAGKYLADNIPTDSKVYWKAGLSAVPLLYISDIEIYPSQINDGYSHFEIGESDVLLAFGMWNDELAYQWAHEADIILIEERRFKGWLREFVLTNAFTELDPSPPTVECREDSRIRIFKKLY